MDNLPGFPAQKMRAIGIPNSAAEFATVADENVLHATLAASGHLPGVIGRWLRAGLIWAGSRLEAL